MRLPLPLHRSQQVGNRNFSHYSPHFVTHTFKLALAVSLFAGQMAIAQVSETDGKQEETAFSFKGFGTFGEARSTNGNAELLRDVTQPHGISNHWSGRNDSNLGLQAEYRINESIQLVTQGVSSYRYNESYNPQLTLGFFKYDFSPRLSFRLGRVGTEFLMQADSRMVGYSYLMVRPPMDFYGIVPINYGDGIDARLRWPMGDGIIRVDGFAGYARESIPPYTLDGSKVAKGSIGYEEGMWQVRYTFAQAKFAHEIDTLDPLRQSLALVGASSAANTLTIKDKLAQYHSLGATYDDGEWQGQGALNYVQQDNAGPFSNSRAWYVLGGRRFGSITPFIGYSWIKSTTQKTLDTGLPNLFFSALNSAVNSAMAASYVDRSTLTLGTRWDFSRNMDLKAQIDFVRASKSSQLLMQDITPDWNGKTTVFSLAFDFVF